MFYWDCWNLFCGQTAILRIHSNNLVRAVLNVEWGVRRDKLLGFLFAPTQEADLCGFLQPAVSCPRLLVGHGRVGGRRAVGGRRGEGCISQPLTLLALFVSWRFTFYLVFPRLWWESSLGSRSNSFLLLLASENFTMPRPENFTMPRP